MSVDERWVQDLRRRADAAVPPVDVDLGRVLPRARRRRTVRRVAGAGAAVTVVLGVVWGATAGALGRDVPPAGVDTPPVSVTPVPTLAPSPDRAGGAGRGLPAEPVVADDGTVTGVPGDPWEGDASHWYVRLEVSYSGEPEGQEWWSSRERPGLMVIDGDLAHAVGRGPSDAVGGAVVLDGARYERVSDPRALPTDPAELLRAVVDALPADEAAPADGVFEEVLAALHVRGGLLPRELRDAYWQVAASLPGASVGPGEDGLARPGEVLRHPAAGGTENRLVRDPGTGLLLESRSARHDEVTTFLEQRTADGLPVPPTLERLGCDTWAACAR